MILSLAPKFNSALPVGHSGPDDERWRGRGFFFSMLPEFVQAIGEFLGGEKTELIPSINLPKCSYLPSVYSVFLPKSPPSTYTHEQTITHYRWKMLSCFLKSILLLNPSFLVSPTSSNILFQEYNSPNEQQKGSWEIRPLALSRNSHIPTQTTTLSKFQLRAANTSAPVCGRHYSYG